MNPKRERKEVIKLDKCEKCGCPVIGKNDKLHYNTCEIYLSYLNDDSDRTAIIKEIDLKSKLVGRKFIINDQIKSYLESINSYKEKIKYYKKEIQKVNEGLIHITIDEVYECRWDCLFMLG